MFAFYTSPTSAPLKNVLFMNTMISLLLLLTIASGLATQNNIVGLATESKVITVPYSMLPPSATVLEVETYTIPAFNYMNGSISTGYATITETFLLRPLPNISSPYRNQSLSTAAQGTAQIITLTTTILSTTTRTMVYPLSTKHHQSPVSSRRPIVSVNNLDHLLQRPRNLALHPRRHSSSLELRSILRHAGSQHHILGAGNDNDDLRASDDVPL